MRVGIRSCSALGKICRVLMLGVAAIALVIPGGDVGFSQSGTGASPYTFTTIDVPNVPNLTFTQAIGIDCNGRIVGSFFDASGIEHGYVRDATGTFTTFDFPNSFGTRALGINCAGQIVGFFLDASRRYDRSHGFLRDAAGTFTRIDVPNSTGTVAFGINKTGQIAGSYYDASGIYFHGFVRDAQTGTFTTIDDPNSFSIGATIATGINDSGQIVGYFFTGIFTTHGFLRDAATGTLTTIDAPNSTATAALGINSGGQIVGYYTDTSDHSHGYFRDATGMFTTIDVPNSFVGSTLAQGINDSGQIVGRFLDVSFITHGFLANPSVAVIVLPGVPGSWTPRIRDARASGKFTNILTLVGDFASMVRTHLMPSQMKEDPVYDDLTNTLKSKGIDVFVMPWDWANGGYQKGAADLDQFIRDHNFAKVDIIAHSAGGIVTQQYIQNRLKASADPHVRNLILLGTPNRGTLIAHCGYYIEFVLCAADNAQARQQASFFQLVLNAFVFPLAVVQGITAVHDLMPTFPYLQLDRSLFAPVNNTYLHGLDQQTLSKISQFQAAGIAPYTVRGTEVPTPGIFVVGLNRNRLTRSLKPWVVKNTITTPIFQGDGSSLAGSATIPGFNDVPVPNATHIEGLLNCIKEAYPRLRDTGTLACGPQVRRAKTYIYIQASSPVRILLADPRGRLTGTEFATGSDVADIPTSTLFQSDHPGIFIDEAIQGKYTLDVLGIGSGGEFELSIAFPNAFPTGFDTTGERISRTIRPGQKLRFAFDALAFQDVTNLFAAFQARLEINSASGAFEMNSTFTLGLRGTISPATQPVTIQVGEGFLVTIPAGSFHLARSGRRFVFEGTVNGVALEANLTSTRGNTYSLKIEGAGVRNLPSANPVEVRLGIGNYGGSVSANAEFER